MDGRTATRELEDERPPPPYPANVDRWAVLVGISEYSDKGIRNLEWASRDASEMAELLQTAAGGAYATENVKLLLDDQATSAGILRALRSFLKKPKREDIVLLYVAAHGAPDPDRLENVYLLTHDTQPEDISGTALPMREIELSLRDSLLAERVVILFDTCRSGAIVAGHSGARSADQDAAIVNNYLQQLSSARSGIALLTSADARETSLEGAQWGGGHGVFTHFVLEGLRGAADGAGAVPRDGKVGARELFDYVQREVQKATGGRQHPTVGPTTFDPDLPLAITATADAERLRALGDTMMRIGGRRRDPERFGAAADSFYSALEFARLPRDQARGALPLGTALRLAGDLEGAVGVLEQATARSGTDVDPEVWYELGRSLYELGRKEESAVALRRYVDAAPSGGAAEQLDLVEGHLEELTLDALRGRALLIGVNHYIDSQLPTLAGAVNDTMLMRRCLSRFGFADPDVQVLADGSATAEGIRSALRALADDATADDAVVIHFSGMAGSGPDMYLIPHDFDRDSVVGITAHELDELLTAIRASHVLVLLDTNFNDEFGGLARRSGAYQLIVATMAHAYEARITIDGELLTCGALTAAVYGFLTGAAKPPTLGQLVAGVERDLEAQGVDQKPFVVVDPDVSPFTRPARCMRVLELRDPRLLGETPRALEGALSGLRRAGRSTDAGLELRRAELMLAERDDGATAALSSALAALSGSPQPVEAWLRLVVGMAEVGSLEEITSAWQRTFPLLPSDATTAELHDAFEALSTVTPHALLVNVEGDQQIEKRNLARLRAWGIPRRATTVIAGSEATQAGLEQALRRMLDEAGDDPCVFWFVGPTAGLTSEPAILGSDHRSDGVYDLRISDVNGFVPEASELVTLISGTTTLGIDPRPRPVGREIRVVEAPPPDPSLFRVGKACFVLDTSKLPTPRKQTGTLGALAEVAQISWIRPGVPTRDAIIEPRARRTAISTVFRSILDQPLEEACTLLRTEIRRRLERDDRWPSGRLELGVVLAELGRYAEAIESLERAVALYTDLSEYAKEESRPMARARWRRRDARLQLGRVLAESGGDYSRAVSELKVAVREDEDDPVGHYYLGRATLDMIECETREIAHAALRRYLELRAPLGHEREVRRMLDDGTR